MLPSIFEKKKKNCSNRTKSLLIVNLILSAKNESFAVERRFVI